MLLFFCCLGGGRVCFLLFGPGGACYFFCFLAVGSCLFFLLFGPGACYSFCCLGGRRVFCLLFGRGTGVHSLTGLPGLSSSDPTTKKTKQEKKHGFP